MTKRVLITGACGFVGSHLARFLVDLIDYELVLLDRIDVAGNLNRLVQYNAIEYAGRRWNFHWHDLKAPISPQLTKQLGRVDQIIHLAAATHVDRSINSPSQFVMDNVVGTMNVLDYAREHGNIPTLIFSTDEVYGPCLQSQQPFVEEDAHAPSNPYSASKSAAEMLAQSYAQTYALPVTITRCCNIIGEMQHPEKAVPLMVAKILADETVMIHTDDQGVGSRFYIDVLDVCEAVRFVVARGLRGVWNITSTTEVDNLSLARLIAKRLDKELKFALRAPSDTRPGHDIRYCISGAKLRDAGWGTRRTFAETLDRVVEFTRENAAWR